MSERMTASDLLSKIVHEGGVDEAVRYGITHEDVPEEITRGWMAAQYAIEDYDSEEPGILDWLENNCE